jgi:hypothetical protein
MEEEKEEKKAGLEEETEGIPKEVFEKDARFKVISEGSGEASHLAEAVEAGEKAPETLEEKRVEFREEPIGKSEQEQPKEVLKREETEEERVVEVEDTLERVISAPTIEASEPQFPVSRRVPTEPARFFEFDEKAGLVKMEEGAVFTYGAEPEPEKVTSRFKWLAWFAIGFVIFLLILFLAFRVIF